MNFSKDSIAGGNICVIWVDDMIDVYTWRKTFGLEIKTPNLDRLMSEGVRFTNAYATVPLCAPCRAELATGISPFRSGLVDLNRFWRDVYPPEKAWAYDLRRAGFYNFTTGKVDSNYKPMPEEYRRMLFHEDASAEDSGRRRDVHAYLDKGPGIKGVGHPGDDGGQDGKFFDFQVAQNAIDHLGRADPNRRQLIQLGFKHPHYNLIAPDRFYSQYNPSDIVWPDIAAPEDYFGPQPGFGVYEAAYIANGPWTPEKAGDNAWREIVRAYFACISHVDHEVGRFLDALRASPFANNTTVIFLSDNGFNLGNHDSFHKMSQWDSAAHIPLGMWHAELEPREETLPVSLHNIPKTIMELAGLPARADWTSGQSLLPLIDDSFGTYDVTKSPITCVFGTLSVRPSVEGLTQYRYFRYPNGEEHVYDLVDDPGETLNIADKAPLDTLRDELTRGALDLGLDLRGFENPAEGVNAMMAVDGSVVMAGGRADNDYWAYGSDAEKIVEEKDGGTDTLWYMAGPDDYILHCPANIEKIRIATVVTRQEKGAGKGPQPEGKRMQIVAHPDSPIHFETSERVEVDVKGSSGDDVMIGPKHGSATFYGGAGNDTMIAKAKQANRRHGFYGEAGNDTLHGGPGRDTLDGGSGDDLIFGSTNRNNIYGGHGNDVIHDGEGASTIDAGPGQNTLHLGPGDHEVSTGTGITHITPEDGAKQFKPAYGGVTIIKQWHKDQIYDVSAWPEAPQITQTDTRIRLRCSLTILDIHRAPKNIDLSAQLRT